MLIKSATDMIEKEHGCLAATFEITSKEVNALVHPFQQFASTCFPQVDEYSHLDMINKMSHV
jgi:hypothetical protein